MTLFIHRPKNRKSPTEQWHAMLSKLVSDNLSTLHVVSSMLNRSLKKVSMFLKNLVQLSILMTYHFLGCQDSYSTYLPPLPTNSLDHLLVYTVQHKISLKPSPSNLSFVWSLQILITITPSYTNRKMPSVAKASHPFLTPFTVQRKPKCICRHYHIMHKIQFARIQRLVVWEQQSFAQDLAPTGHNLIYGFRL